MAAGREFHITKQKQGDRFVAAKMGKSHPMKEEHFQPRVHLENLIMKEKTG